jgi:ketosteroid isomerase-like protein
MLATIRDRVIFETAPLTAEGVKTARNPFGARRSCVSHNSCRLCENGGGLKIAGGAVGMLAGRRTEQMVNNDALVRQLYEGFNRRDIPAVLTLLAENVDWANGMDGGHVHGRDAVRAYWTKQWAAIAPRVDPMHVTQGDDGATTVEVHQVVRDLEGKVLLDETVRHVFEIDKGLVTRFDIENAGGLAAIAHD